MDTKLDKSIELAEIRPIHFKGPGTSFVLKECPNIFIAAGTEGRPLQDKLLILKSLVFPGCSSVSRDCFD